MLKKSLLLTLLLALLVPWAANAQQTITVYDQGGTTNNGYVPMYGGYFDDNTKSEFVIPAAKLTDMDGGTIMAMKFHISSVSSWGNGWVSTQTVFLKEVESDQLSAYSGTDGATVVYTGQFTVPASTATEFEITFTTPYAYNGGNLLVGIYNEAGGSGNYRTVNWKGETVNGASGAGSSGSSLAAVSFTQRNFIPQTTFTYVTTDPWISLSPSSTTVFTGSTQNLTASYGNVSGTPTITYSSSNNKIASVSGSGTSATVTGNSVGTATITATMTYNATEYTATCAVTVEEPSYCTPSFSNTSDYIKSFTTTGGEQNINNTNTGQGTGGYSNFYDTHFVSAEPDTEIGFSVVRGYEDTYQYGLWVDWNKDYEFDNATELVASTTSAQDWSSSFTIPASTPAGDYHMRILQLYGSSTTLTACASASYGEGEDYKLTVTAANPYQKPVNLQVTNLAATSATLTWEAPNSDVLSYKYQYQPQGGEWTTLTSTTATSAPLTLTANTTYNFQVQAIYAGNNESGFVSKTFTTLIAIPYEYGFEDATEFGKWEMANDIGNMIRVSNSDMNDYISTTGLQYSRTGDYSFVFFYIDYPDTDPEYQTLISPELTGMVNGLHVEFYYRTAGSSYPETFRVGYSTTDKQLSSFTWGSQTTSGETDYQLFKANFPAEAKYIAVQHMSDDKYFLLLDDFSFTEAPACLEPYDVIAQNITTTSANITWTNGGSETEWDIYVTTDPTDVPDDGTTPTYANISTKPYPLPGLTHSTWYYVYVRSACHSDWSTAGIFATECVDAVLPYSYNFDNSSQFEICWNVINTYDAYDHVNVMTVSGTNKCLAFYFGSPTTATLAAVSPEFDNTYNLNEYEITFDACYYGGSMSNGTVRVGIMTDPTDFTTFQLVKELSVDNELSSGWASYKAKFNSYTGSGKYFAIQNIRTANGYVLVDNIEVDLLPSCIEPDNLTVTSPTAHGATFSWTNGGSETEWHLYFGKDNTAPADDIDLGKVTVADSNPFTMTTGLDPETDYYVWVRANCGGTDGYSMWVGPETFTTGIACPAPTGLAYSEVTAHTAKLSWDGTSDSYNVKYRTAAYVIGETTDFSNGLPTGWTNGSGALNTTEGTATISSGSYWSIGTNCGVFDKHAYFNMYSSCNYWLITPSITLGTNDSFSFDVAYTKYKTDGSNVDPVTGGPHKLYVLISTDNKAHWTVLREWNNTTSSYVLDNIPKTGQTVNIDLSAYTGQDVYMAILGVSSGTDYDNNIHIDNIAVGTPVAEGTWTNKTADASPYTATGLEAETKYEAQVQGNCGGEGLSQWSSSVFFTTDIACPAPTGLTASNPTSSSFDIQWTNGGSEDWIVAYKKTTDTDFTEVDVNMTEVTEEAGLITYTLGGLDAETEYIVKVQDNCEVSYAGDGQSEWTAEVNYSTLAACSALNPVVSDITHHNATVTWNGESASGFTVNYREAAHIDGTSEEFSGTSIPTGWTKYSGLVDNVVAGTATLATTTYGWTMTTASTNVFSSNHIRLNIYGSSVNYWLVTPEINLAANSGLSFDLALTKYDSNGASTTSVSGTCADDRFVVLIYANDAWSILREWNNDGTGDAIYNNIATAGENVQIDLSSYSGTVKIAFYGESTVSVTGDDNDMHIDNVTIGANVPAGDWQTKAAATTTADLTGLTAGTKYDLKVVPNCDETLESATVQFSTVSPDSKWFITAGDWSTAANWEPTGAPTINQSVTLYANVTIESGCVAEAKTITQGTHTITIEDGGQLKHDNSGVTATVKKHIIGYGAGNTDTKLGYYLISNPLYQTINKHTSASTPNISSTGMLTGTYDFYNWSNSNQGSEWRNYETSAFDMSYSMYSYLYANEADADLTFTGTLRASNSYVNRYLTDYSSSYTFGAWYLLGNPFVCNAYLVNASTSGTALPYYRMDAVNGTFEAVTSGPIAPMEGIFYEAETSGNVYMVRTAPTPSLSAGNGNLNINIAQVVNSRDAHRSTDNAIIRFDGGQQLGKFSFNENNAKVYIPQEGKDYAVVNAENAGEMPVNFKAAENGSYTISFTAEDVNFSYLHLIDNLTGNDVNLLETPSYSFDARTTDYASRFKLVFAKGNADMGDDFGFFDASGNLLVLGIEGKATLQLIDVTGRILSSETFSGNYSKAINASAGVYMLRLIQGNDVRTQKIVVK